MLRNARCGARIQRLLAAAIAKRKALLVAAAAALAFALACRTTNVARAAGDESAPEKKASAGDLDPKLPGYEKASTEVSGSIKSVGSDTMLNLMDHWSASFTKIYPNVRAEIEGKGSATAPPALIEGTGNFGPMSRDWKKEEIEKFEAKYGYKPTTLPAAIDMLAVYVNKDNPIEGLSFQQIDAVFSKARKGGYPNDVLTWGDLGMTGEWKDKPINLYGRNSASGTYAFFKEHAMFKGDFKDSVKEQPGSSAVVQGVASDKYGIGYSGIGYKTADVRAIPLALKEGKKFVPAEPDYAYRGQYPLARFLYISVNYKPGSQLDPLRAEFLKYVLSRNGQEDVDREGFLPLTEKVAARGLKMVGLSE
ncbi:MAG TPA: PstS family phosphate ABC transporter substrate-binding protein [Pirellulales bacterium]|jgi:phosphate transport system substrate-binding protein|nr:PstS family phosphate ABC transporter substrate-binding protein [Pirellulales bacterium]